MGPDRVTRPIAFRSRRLTPSRADQENGVAPKSIVVLLARALQPSADVLPGLSLLSPQVRILPSEGSALLEAPDADLILVDGRQERAHARGLCRLIRTTGADVRGLLIVRGGGLAVV